MSRETTDAPTSRPPDEPSRCWWCAGDTTLQAYHDTEWGFPVANDVRLFEKIVLEGFQSGLSWRTILNKRENFRRAFAGFDPERVARFDDADVERLLGDVGIVRHGGKIRAAIHNAARALELRRETGSLAAYFWRWEPAPETRPARMTEDVARTLATSEASTALSRDLKRRGWRFVGPTTAYAFMQAMGLVNDHAESCWAREAALEARRGFEKPT